MRKFAMTPVEAISDKRLTLPQLRVLVALYSFANDKDDVVFPRRETLAGITGYKPDKISEFTSQLQALGWLEKQGNGGRSRSVEYRLTIPSDEALAEPKKVARPSAKKAETLPDCRRVYETETLPDCGGKTLPDCGGKTLPQYGRGIEQTMEQTMEQTITPYTPPQPIRAKSPTRQVFDYWASVMKKNGRTVLDDKRSRAIEGRLNNGFTVDDILLAVDGCAATPHNMGKNKDGKKWNDIELICRNASQVERFRDTAIEARKRNSDLDDFFEEGQVIEGQCTREVRSA